jgi:glycosyltransferase involved in cell wall biosynthesis
MRPNSLFTPPKGRVSDVSELRLPGENATVPNSPSTRSERPLRVAIAHEWLVRYAGSERVAEQLLAAFPGSRVLTTILARDEVPAALRGAEPAFVDRLPGSRGHHEWYLPLMPLAWRLRRPLANLDAVIASSHACANAVRTAEDVPLISYCHTPMRYAWDFESEQERFPVALRPVARAALSAFRRWDRSTSRRVTQFVANSRAVAGRIASFYGRSSIVVHPPVRTDFFTPSGQRGDRFLYVGRLTGYKRPDLVVEAFRELPHALDVVGEGPLRARLEERATSNVRFHGTTADEQLRELYRAARALVYPVDEDFGIAMAEAQSCGTPVVALAAGGALDKVEPGVSGWLLERQDVDELRSAVRRASEEDLPHAEIRSRALRFAESRFREEIRDVVEAVVAGAG